MLFRNFRNFDRLFREFDELFFEQPHLKNKEQTETVSDENGDWEKRTYVSDSGLFSYTFLTRKQNTNKPTNEIDTLKIELEKCVENQDFEKAVELRDKIKKIESNIEGITKLNKELDECVKKQDFEKAIKLRDKIKNLK